jgi:hypothetical protein
MSDATFTPGYSFNMNICLKSCKNRDKLCDTCIKFSHFEEIFNARHKEKIRTK